MRPSGRLRRAGLRPPGSSGGRRLGRAREGRAPGAAEASSRARACCARTACRAPRAARAAVRRLALSEVWMSSRSACARSHTAAERLATAVLWTRSEPAERTSNTYPRLVIPDIKRLHSFHDRFDHIRRQSVQGLEFYSIRQF